MLISCSQDLSGLPEKSFQILSQFLWFYKYIEIESTAIHFPKLFNKDINFMLRLLENGNFKSCVNIKIYID